MPLHNHHEKPRGVPTLSYSYQEFSEDVHLLAKRIEAMNLDFKKIYGLPRGGLPMAVHLSNLLRLDLRLEPINPEVWSREAAAKILVVDDIADSGETLKLFQDAGFFLATLFYNNKSLAVPQLWVREKDERWIDFPWEV